MAIDLLGMVRGALSPDAIGKISSTLGESPASVQKAFEAAVPTLLSGIAAKVKSGGVGNLLSMFSSGGQSASIVDNFSSLVGGSGAASLIDSGKNLVQSVLGDKATAVVNAISSHAGISSASAGSVLAMAGPLTTGAIQKALPGGVNASSLMELMNSQKSSILSALPSGLAGIAGLGGLAAVGSATVGKLSSAVDKAESGGMKMWPILALLGVLVIGGLIWYFTRGASPATNAVTTAKDAATSAATSVSSAAQGVFAALGDLLPHKLPDGTTINIPKLGVENKLLTYLDSNAPVDKSTWFDFDRLLFDTGRAQLQPASQDQLDAVTAILKAYPKVKMRIGGYTDNTGSKEANLKLSQDRANTVMAALIAKGIDATRLDAKGFGEDHPVADNSTPEGRQKNRRISMRVLEK